MLESLISQSQSTVSISLTSAFIYMVVAGALGFVISMTYLKLGRVSRNFAATLVILPMLVCVVMLVVNGNLGTSVAIVGAFSLIRFRSLQGTSKEIALVFFAMSVGLTCSVGYLLFAAGVTVFVCLILLVLQFTRYAENKTAEQELRITIPENLDYYGIFDDLFEAYTKKHRQMRVKTTNMGSLYEITYYIEMKNEEKQKEFMDAIRCRNGNLTVICGRCDYGVMEEL